MDLICFLYEGWNPRIRPASQRREWMDQTPEAFAYRCLPLNIANAHGWEILAGCGFEVEWNGGPLAEDVTVYPDKEGDADVPVALFGQGTFTVHVQGLFRTPPGWNLWVGGPPNGMKDGVAPLSGVVETDWSPYTFTMNWRLTRPNNRVRFEADDVICHIFPVLRDTIEATEPIFLPIESDPDLQAAFETWSRSRDEFQLEVVRNPPSKPSDKWQKLYYRGVQPDGSRGIEDHRSKLRPKEFGSGNARRCQGRGATNGSVAHGAEVNSAVEDRISRLEAELVTTRQHLARRDWVLATQNRLRGISPTADVLLRQASLDPLDFRDAFYALNRPVVLADVATTWAAFHKWNPEYLRQTAGTSLVEVQADRGANPDYERDKEAHRRQMSFSAFLDAVEHAESDIYLTAYNAAANREALGPLSGDLGSLPGILDSAGCSAGMLWIGPKGTFTPLHHDLTNNLLIQIKGRKHVVLVSPNESMNLYNNKHVFSDVRDVLSSDIDFEKYPMLRGVKAQTVTLEAGDALFIPVGWWHQVRSLDFSISLTCTNFVWPNDAWNEYPCEET